MTLLNSDLTYNSSVTKPDAGNYLLIHYGFAGDAYTPQLILLKPGSEHFQHLSPRDQTLTLGVDQSKRYCTGWHDLASAESFPCPEAAELPSQYEQCRHCQIKTGFNPAFYNADSVSPQQEARNRQPHSLYLAHFGPGVVKVGITWAERGLRRLLEQGARSAIILKTFPSATIARQYEAKIAALPGIVETIQPKAKYKLLAQAYDETLGTQELLAAQTRIIKEVGIVAEDNKPQALHGYYFGEHAFTTNNLINLHGETSTSGLVRGMIGGVVITEQDDTHFMLPISKWRGYHVTISYEQQANQHAPQQISLF